MSGLETAVGELVEQVLAPLIAADEGHLYVVKVSEDSVHLHLAGRFAGCPGNTLATRRVIEPLIHSVAPDMAVNVTSGAIIPAQAKRL